MTAIDTQNAGDANPSGKYFAITPSDTVDFVDGETRGIYVGVTGNLVAVSEDGHVVTFLNAVQGTVLPIRAVRINATSTTATNLVGLR